MRITSPRRSGTTFFRVVMHRIYGVDTYAAFQAAEVLFTAGAGALAGNKRILLSCKAPSTREMPERSGWRSTSPKPAANFTSPRLKFVVQHLLGRKEALIGCFVAMSFSRRIGLKKEYPSFFRRGTSGDWKIYLSSEQQQMFRSKHQSVMETRGLFSEKTLPRDAAISRAVLRR